MKKEERSKKKGANIWKKRKTDEMKVMEKNKRSRHKREKEEKERRKLLASLQIRSSSSAVLV